MFWKRKDKTDLDFELPETKRTTHRIRPGHEAPVFFQIQGQDCRVYDISAGGASFQIPPGVHAGDVVPASFRLPHINSLVEVKVRIVSVENDIARSGFVDLSLADREEIHRYVLEEQKRRGRKRPSDRSTSSGN